MFFSPHHPINLHTYFIHHILIRSKWPSIKQQNFFTQKKFNHKVKIKIRFFQIDFSIMETKQAQSYLSKNNVYKNLNNCEIINSRVLLQKIRAKNQQQKLEKPQQQQQQQHKKHYQRQQQRQQQLHHQHHHIQCFNDKDLQQFPWYLSKTTMFSHPRRRKFNMKQGQNVRKMFQFTDILPDEHFNALKLNTFMLKSSIATKMWHN